MAVERFLAKAIIPSDVLSGCWEWRAAKAGGGYGRFAPDGRRQVQAHRFAYEIVCGAIPDGLDLDHLCRNRGCVNPAHLEPVTRQENVRRGLAMESRWNRGLPSKNPGERHKLAKLTDERVRAIRRRVAAGEEQKTLAAEFGVSCALVCLVVKRKIWKHVSN